MIVVPLATWIYLAFAILAFAVYFIRPRSRSYANEKDAVQTSPLRSKKSIWRKILDGLYYILILAMLAMLSLIIARMSVAQLGIGLLPFTYVSFLLAAGFHAYIGLGRVRQRTDVAARSQRRTMQALNVIFWLAQICVLSIEIAVLAGEGDRHGHRSGQQSQYPISDEITDVAVVIGVACVLIVLEIFGV